jgi:lipopolysaccharide export system protein LptC
MSALPVQADDTAPRTRDGTAAGSASAGQRGDAAAGAAAGTAIEQAAFTPARSEMRAEGQGDGLRRPGQYLVDAAAERIRFLPSARRLARRRVAITLTKWLLPLGAVALLAVIALWPEIDRATDQTRLAFRRLSGSVEGARMVEPRYHGIDEIGRPYTLTAATARQVSQERIELTQPKGDMTLEDGTWLMLNAKLGTFMQKGSQLDLWKDVTLYRDDGTTLTTQSASIDLKLGAAASAEPVHAEGPFGVLDAQGFTVVDKGAAIQFSGPAHLVLNGASP